MSGSAGPTHRQAPWGPQEAWVPEGRSCLEASIPFSSSFLLAQSWHPLPARRHSLESCCSTPSTEATPAQQGLKERLPFQEAVGDSNTAVSRTDAGEREAEHTEVPAVMPELL